ncbi:MAG TPA: fumarate hydratase C-terminal domain-containing protein, partial [Candidatus Deferrimicrobium sp.]|nr:fumarate hydratase C-terminal domain-containing protein [Candidatus Deferrimicrobium sp.]
AEGLKRCGAVYFHAVGGAGTLIANSVKEVKTVYKLEEFGTPEAFWVIEVEDFPVVVTMDANGGSLHKEVKEKSEKIANELMGI